MNSFKVVHLSMLAQDQAAGLGDKRSDAFFAASWGSLFARRLKKCFPDLDVEAWRPASDIHLSQIREVEETPCRIFPNKRMLIRRALSWEMIQLLRGYSYEKSLILHVHGLNPWILFGAAKLIPRARLIATDHGGFMTSGKGRHRGFKKTLSRSIFPRLAALTYLRRSARDELEKIPRHPDLHWLPVGANFQRFSPLDKAECRKKLGLAQEKIYALYVGRFYRLKSVDLILSVCRELKKTLPFEVIMVGGENTPVNDLYAEVRRAGGPVFETQPWERMSVFYGAADFFLSPALHPGFHGLDVSWMEALACNRPVLSAQLTELPFDSSSLGISLARENECLDKTRWLCGHFQKFIACRESARPYLDGIAIIPGRLLQIYHAALAGTKDT